MVGGFRLLRQKRRHSSGYNHPCGYRTDAALHRRVRLLLQVRQIITFSPKRKPTQTRLVLFLFFFCVLMRSICAYRQEEESAGGTGVREGETPAGESGGKRSRSLQERVHGYTFTN